ncbi:MAG: helix-turn-helix transcriptional regulator [Lachnospiraceae bacterium]|nr:helix-turn-helix transcriptional regulator [Lachnospiraceae bacterium]
MEKDKIGAILGKRIHQCGYTRESFAEKSGIGLSSLKKYISGAVAYNYEVLDILATELDCSYDYLLGKSPSPQREYHEISEQTHLSEEAICNINKRARYYDEEFEARRYIKVLDLLLQEEETFESICDFLISSKFMDCMMGGLVNAIQESLNQTEPTKKMGIQKAKRISLESQLMIDLVTRLKVLKEKLTPEFIEELKKLDTEEKVYEAIEKLGGMFTKK